MENWTPLQVAARTAQFEEVIQRQYPQNSSFFKNPREFYRGLTELWNYLDAVQGLAWEQLLPFDAVCLDLGSGTGWLGAFLSKMKKVSKIYALDSSRFFQTVMRPGMESLMGGVSSKVIPIEGFFTPILVPDKFFDAVMASSSLHHADHLEDTLVDIHRVLKDGGILFILNELPHNNFGYLFFIVKGFVAILFRSLFRRYKNVSRAISSSGVLDDPFLGDRRYPFWYWQQALAKAGFEIIECHRTGLRTLKSERSGQDLVHFICRKRHS